MATIRAISLRLKSVKSIQKITKSMKMVSAAKYAKAERELKSARPFGVTVENLYAKAEVDKLIDVEKTTPKALYIVVTSDRGLCGAVHSSVAKHIRGHIGKNGESSKIVCIGEKAKSSLHRQFSNKFLFVCNEVGRLPPTFLDASQVANQILKSDYEFDIGKIVFNQFRSVVSYTTSEKSLYRPVTIKDSPNIRNYEEADEETIENFVEFSMAGLLYYAMKEGAASEQSARMTAMDNASKNAADMIDKLTLTYNRTRQAEITKELIEIISGASALS